MLLDELSKGINLSKQMTRKYLKRLEEKDLVKVVSKKPLRFSLTQNAEAIFGLVAEQ